MTYDLPMWAIGLPSKTNCPGGERGLPHHPTGRGVGWPHELIQSRGGDPEGAATRPYGVKIFTPRQTDDSFSLK